MRAKKLAKLRVDAHEAGQKVLRGNSNCRGFSSGGKFTLKEHARADLNADYVLRQVSHVADRSNYSNHFDALPAKVVFRPVQRTRRPIALGSQTATVVGKSGEEIWTDKYGRVKVHFPWDRKGKKDEKQLVLDSSLASVGREGVRTVFLAAHRARGCGQLHRRKS
jgi:type VI secretion system secreted protein VgrG